MTEPLQAVTIQNNKSLDLREICCELTLFVSGASGASASAIINTRLIGDTCLDGAYQLSIINIQDDTAACERNNVFATPTLIKTFPLPERRIVGNVSDVEQVLKTLEITNTHTPPAALD